MNKYLNIPMLAKKPRRPSWFLRGIVISFLLFVSIFIYQAWQVYSYGQISSTKNADAAVVLGAAAWGERPSPVLRERINHAIDLYKAKRVHMLLVTGGTPKTGYPTEAEVSRRYAIAHGVAAQDIFVENTSRTTFGNLQKASYRAKPIGINSMLIVSDPMHMRRAMLIAKDLNLVAYPSPTQSSRYSGHVAQIEFLLKETTNCIAYILFK